MPKLTRQLPRYCRHKASGQAVVKFWGKTHYLGPFGSRASKAEYRRLMAEYLAPRDPIDAIGSRSDLMIVEMLAAFRRFAVRHYQKDGMPTRELGNIDDAIKPLKFLYGRELVRDFGPLKLKSLQALMVKGYTDANGNHVGGLSRGVINNRIGRIKHIFKWAVSEEMAPPNLAHALVTVQGLKRGRTEARETAPVKPVSDADVEATSERLSQVVADMVRIQRLTGARPGEICTLRPCDVDRTDDVWIYQLPSHKTEHHGRERLVYIGPQAQAILLPYLLRDSASFCFSPKDSERKRRARLREARKTPVQPSQRDRSTARPQSPREAKTSRATKGF